MQVEKRADQPSGRDETWCVAIYHGIGLFPCQVKKKARKTVHTGCWVTKTINRVN